MIVTPEENARLKAQERREKQQAMEANAKRLRTEEQRYRELQEAQARHEKAFTFTPMEASLNQIEQEAQEQLALVAALRLAIAEIKALPEEEEGSLAECEAIQQRTSLVLDRLRTLLWLIGERYSSQEWRIFDSVRSGFSNLRDPFDQAIKRKQREAWEAAERVRRQEAFEGYEKEYAAWLEAGRRGDRVGPRPEPPHFPNLPEGE